MRSFWHRSTRSVTSAVLVGPSVISTKSLLLVMRLRRDQSLLWKDMKVCLADIIIYFSKVMLCWLGF